MQEAAQLVIGEFDGDLDGAIAESIAVLRRDCAFGGSR
jgi:hypothetical protein